MRGLVLTLIAACVLPSCGKGAKEAEAAAPTPAAAEPASSPPASAEARPAAVVDVAALLAELGKAAGCPEAGEHRHWCLAADGWATGTAAELPEGPHAWLGLAIGLGKDRPAQQAITEGVMPAALATLQERGKTWAGTSSVTPRTAAERQMLSEAMFNMALVFKGVAESAEVAEGLIEYIGDLPSEVPDQVVPGERGWRLEGDPPTEIRRVGEFWVAVQVQKEGPPDVYVSLFTDKLQGR